MGHADLVPFLGTTFIDWFPVVILIPAVSAYFNVGGRCLSICGVKDPYDNDEESPSDGPLAISADIADGKALVNEGINFLFIYGCSSHVHYSRFASKTNKSA